MGRLMVKTGFGLTLGLMVATSGMVLTGCGRDRGFRAIKKQIKAAQVAKTGHDNLTAENKQLVESLAAEQKKLNDILAKSVSLTDTWVKGLAQVKTTYAAAGTSSNNQTTSKDKTITNGSQAEEQVIQASLKAPIQGQRVQAVSAVLLKQEQDAKADKDEAATSTVYEAHVALLLESEDKQVLTLKYTGLVNDKDVQSGAVVPLEIDSDSTSMAYLAQLQCVDVACEAFNVYVHQQDDKQTQVANKAASLTIAQAANSANKAATVAGDLKAQAATKAIGASVTTDTKANVSQTASTARQGAVKFNSVFTFMKNKDALLPQYDLTVSTLSNANGGKVLSLNDYYKKNFSTSQLQGKAAVTKSVLGIAATVETASSETVENLGTIKVNVLVRQGGQACAVHQLSLKAQVDLTDFISGLPISLVDAKTGEPEDQDFSQAKAQCTQGCSDLQVQLTVHGTAGGDQTLVAHLHRTQSGEFVATEDFKTADSVVVPFKAADAEFSERTTKACSAATETESKSAQATTTGSKVSEVGTQVQSSAKTANGDVTTLSKDDQAAVQN